MKRILLEDLEHNGIGSAAEHKMFYAEFGLKMELNKKNLEILLGFLHFNHLYSQFGNDCKRKYAEALKPIEEEKRTTLQNICANWTAKTLHDKDPERNITYMMAAYRKIDVLQEKTKRARHSAFLKVLLEAPEFDSPR